MKQDHFPVRLIHTPDSVFHCVLRRVERILMELIRSKSIIPQHLICDKNRCISVLRFNKIFHFLMRYRLKHLGNLIFFNHFYRKHIFHRTIICKKSPIKLFPFSQCSYNGICQFVHHCGKLTSCLVIQKGVFQIDAHSYTASFRCDRDSRIRHALQLVHGSIFDLGVSEIVREEVRQSFFHLFSEFIEFHTVPPSNLILSKKIERPHMINHLIMCKRSMYKISIIFLQKLQVLELF